MIDYQDQYRQALVRHMNGPITQRNIKPTKILKRMNRNMLFQIKLTLQLMALYFAEWLKSIRRSM